MARISIDRIGVRIVSSDRVYQEVGQDTHYATVKELGEDGLAILVKHTGCKKSDGSTCTTFGWAISDKWTVIR